MSLEKNNSAENPDVVRNAEIREELHADVDPARGASFSSLLPFLVFVIFYLGLSIWAKDFYKVPMPTAFLVASAFALLQNHKRKVGDKVEIYARGMGNTDIMLMGLIFILAGSFATVAKGMGAVDSAVLIAQNLVPARFMLAGIFVVACFISLAIGTSCGTIAALTPIAAGLVKPLGVAPEFLIGAVIGGAMFGDNLSMISDTTIAATRTQGVQMRDKFFANFFMVLPAAILCVILYLVSGKSAELAKAGAISWHHVLLVSPYILVLVLALFGINVMCLLFLGTVLASAIGIFCGKFGFWNALDLCGKGTLGMSETLIVAILAGGLLKLIRYNGGISFLMQKIGARIHSSRGCEAGIALLVSAVNLFTANNTVAIVIAGPLAKELSTRFNCSPKRIAGILDTASCVIQGMIPYGAQILIAVGVASAAGIKVSSIGLLQNLWYPLLMALSLFVYILIGSREKA